MGVTLQFVPAQDVPRVFPTDAEEIEFCERTVQDVEDWLASRRIPEGHRRFFHGTSTSAMNNILEFGIDVSSFQPFGDFGAGFYCADNVRTAFRFAFLTSLNHGEGRQSSSLMYFDVLEDDLRQMKKKHVTDDEWTEWTGKCLDGKQQRIYAGDHYDLQLVSGMLVHNPHEVKHDGDTPLAFQDKRIQYCFREENGNLLLRDKNKMGVALFDVYIPPALENDNESENEEVRVESNQ